MEFRDLCAVDDSWQTCTECGFRSPADHQVHRSNCTNNPTFKAIQLAAQELASSPEILSEARYFTVMRKLDHVVELLYRLLRNGKELMTLLDDKFTALESDVTDLEGVEEGVEKVLSTLTQELKDAVAQGGNATQLAQRVQAITDRTDAMKAKFAAAVAANTPAAPAAPADPAAPPA